MIAVTAAPATGASDEMLPDPAFAQSSMAGEWWATDNVKLEYRRGRLCGWVEGGTAQPWDAIVGLNGLALGEATAAHIGIDVQRMKSIAILAVAGATGAAVAVSGGIGFIGIVVPHLLRLASGPDHRTLLLNSALLGAILLVLADVIARVVIAPAELPIGIVTAVLGAPVFLWILLKRRGLVEK